MHNDNSGHEVTITIPCGANVHAGMTWAEARDAAKAVHCPNPYACAEWTMGDADWEHPGTPAPIADSPEDDSPCQWDPMCTGRGTSQITEGEHAYTACDDCAADAVTAADLTGEDEDVLTRTIPLDGGTAIVEHVGERVEVTIRLGDRIVCALALSRAEASALGMAVARPEGPTLDDLFAVADAMHADASTLARAWGTAQPV